MPCPTAGDEFQVVTDTAKAKQIVMYREAKARDVALAKNKRMTLEQLQKQMAQGEVKDLNLILKADVGGSAEVLRDTLEKLSTDKVRVRVLLSGVGAINESDVDLAAASERHRHRLQREARPRGRRRSGARTGGYPPALDHLQPDGRDQEGHGRPAGSDVYRKSTAARRKCARRSRFRKSARWRAAWLRMATSTAIAWSSIMRDGVVVHDRPRSARCKRFKDDVSEVRNGMECGITLNDYSDVKEGDILEAFDTERVATK